MSVYRVIEINGRKVAEVADKSFCWVHNLCFNVQARGNTVGLFAWILYFSAFFLKCYTE